MRLLDAKIQDLRSGARGDIAIRRLHPEYNGEPDLHGIEEAVEIVMAQWPLITAVSKDLQDQETFFGMELHLVLAVHDPKIAQPRAGLDRYRNERKPAPPPPDWLGKGEWKEDPVEFFKRKQAELDALRREMDPDEGDDD